jgi:hypothetical protein
VQVGDDQAGFFDFWRSTLRQALIDEGLAVAGDDLAVGGRRS